MKQTLVFLIAWLAATALNAQESTISGIISIHNSQFDTGKRQYVFNALVEDAFEKAHSRFTDDTGFFKLIFVGVPEKTTVNLIVKKEGLEVVNIDALGAVTGQRDQVRLSMAAPNKIAEYRRQIYNIGKTEAEKNLTALLQKKGKAIEELQKNAKVDSVKIRNLQTEYAALSEQSKKIEEQAQELARKYAPINLDDASPLYQEAFRSFQKGELDQALKILQQANLAQQAEKILQERQNIANVRRAADQRDSIQQQRTADVIKALQFKADLHKSRFEFDSTVVCYEIMLQLDSTNTTTLLSYAYFLDFQNEDKKAIVLYEQALSFAITDELKATFLNNLGSLYRANQQMSEAQKVSTEALQISRLLAVKNPDAFLPNVAATLNNLGIYYRANQQMPQAEKAFKEALQVIRQLAAKNPDVFLSELAMTLNNLGIYYRDIQQMPQAETAFKEALPIYRQLATKNPDAFLSDLAATLNNVGIYYYYNQQKPQAEKAFEEALQIIRLLAAKNPDAFLPGVAMTLNNLGIYYRDNQQMPQAETAFKEALQIRLQLAAKNPDAFLPDVAMTSNNLGAYYRDNQQMPQAEKAFEEALQVYRQLAAKSPNAFLPDVALTLNNLGVLFKDLKKYDSALQYYSEAIHLQEQAIITGHTHFFQEWVRVLLNILEVRDSVQAKKDFVSVVKAGQLMAEGCEHLQKINENLLPIAIGEYRSLSQWALFTQDFALAEKAALRCLELDNMQELVLINLGHSYLLRGQYQQAQVTYEKLKGKKDGEGKDYKQIILDDFVTLEKEGITHPDMAKMKAWIAGW